MYSLAIIYEQDSPTVARLGEYFFQSAYPWPDPLYVDVANDPNQQGVAELIETAQINQFPTILFLREEGGRQEIVTRLEGEQTLQQIRRVAQDVTAGLYDNITDGDTPEGTGWLNLSGLFSGPRLLIWTAVLLYALKK